MQWIQSRLMARMTPMRKLDRLYRNKPFADGVDRAALLLKRYQVLVGEDS